MENDTKHTSDVLRTWDVNKDGPLYELNPKFKDEGIYKEFQSWKISDADVDIWHEWQVTELDEQWVTDGLESRMSEWCHDGPILISAPTGRGKNTFIIKNLIPYALDNGDVFLFSNRIALNIQQKKELLRALKIPNVWSNEELQKQEIFRRNGTNRTSVHVLSYQAALRFLDTNRKLIENLLSGEAGPCYAIFDEAHFFLSDAPFNSNTQIIFQGLVASFAKCTRIYMTATPNNFSSVILQYENRNPISAVFNCFELKPFAHGQKRTAWQYYDFKRNYSNYKIKFFSNIEQLYPQVEKSVKEGEKWLFFIDSRQRQQDIAKALKEQSNAKADCFDKSKKGDDKIWEMLLEGNIPHDVLLTTRALDNGVNITDPDLHNIVIECKDEVSFIQMIGRKRLNHDEDETVNLFVYSPEESEIEKIYSDLQDLLFMIGEYRKDPRNFIQNKWHELHQRYRNLFWLSNHPSPYQSLSGYPNLNEFAETEIRYLQEFYGGILAKMQATENTSEKLDIYPKQVLEWMNLSRDIHWVGDHNIKAAKDKLLQLLEEYMPSGVPQDKHKEFFDKFAELADTIYNGTTTLKKDYRSGPSIMSKALKDLSEQLGCTYKIEGRGTWKIIKQ